MELKHTKLVKRKRNGDFKKFDVTKFSDEKEKKKKKELNECDKIREVGPHKKVGKAKKKNSKKMRKKDCGNVGLACASLIITYGINITPLFAFFPKPI